MRRIAFMFALMVVFGWAAPAQAQWWGGGWGRPCFGGCRPWWGGGWAGPRRFAVLGQVPGPIGGEPDGFGPPRFEAGGWGWRRTMWRREMRWRRFEAWRRWADAGRDAAPPVAGRPRFHLHGWLRRRLPWPPSAAAARPEPPRAAVADAVRDERRRQNRAEAVVALVPTVAPPSARPKVRAAIPSRVLAAAAMLRRPAVPAVLRAPEPPARPAQAGFRRGAPPLSPSDDVHPVNLRHRPTAAPAPIPAASAVPAPAAPAPVAPEPVQRAPADVPVAPLD